MENQEKAKQKGSEGRAQRKGIGKKLDQNSKTSCSVCLKRSRSNKQEEYVDTASKRSTITQLDTEDKELISALVQRVAKIEATVLEILEHVKTTPNNFNAALTSQNNDVIEMDVVQASSSAEVTPKTSSAGQVTASVPKLFEVAGAVEQLSDSEVTSSEEERSEGQNESHSHEDESLWENMRSTALDSGQATKETEQSEFVVNGIDVSEIQSRNAYSYALRLMDVFFTKQEMAVSLLFKSRKSSKPALPRDKVEKLISYVEMRYGSEWDLKILTAKANQKCRDSRDNLMLL